MRNTVYSLIIGFACWFAPPAPAQTNTVDTLLNSYDAVTTLSCEVRRSVETENLPVTFLSRVFFDTHDKLHVENIQPVPRRIVADGTTFFSYIQGDAKGFSRPISQLDEPMMMSLRKVPGTAMDHLLRLKGSTEEMLPPTNGSAIRVGCQTSAGFVTLELDASNRLTDLRFFDSPAMTIQSAHYQYSRFEEPAPGVHIPTLHKAKVTLNGVTTEETTHIDHLEVNQPIAASLFVASTFFEGVSFADNFAETLAGD